MSHYVRVFTNYWQHRKTAKLRAKIGNDAFWVPPRLWSYAAENQPDGDFSAYAPQELAMLIGCEAHATSIVEALQQAGFMDGMRLHDWDEHNAYHVAFSERARKASLARWATAEEEIERKGKDTSIPSSMLQASVKHAPSIEEEFTEFWNAYPKKTAKADAKKAFKKHGCSNIIAEILLSLERQKATADWCKEHGKFIPYPATWLNGHRWEDVVEDPEIEASYPPYSPNI